MLGPCFGSCFSALRELRHRVGCITCLAHEQGAASDPKSKDAKGKKGGVDEAAQEEARKAADAAAALLAEQSAQQCALHLAAGQQAYQQAQARAEEAAAAAQAAADAAMQVFRHQTVRMSSLCHELN